MPCPHCAATATVEQPRRTALGYRTFRCPICRRVCNERTGTLYNYLQYPTDPVLLVVLWRLRDKLRLRNLAEMLLERGFVFSHETVRDWEACCALLLTTRLRAKRRGMVGTKWHADETYLRVDGRWCSLYRAIDREGNLVDVLLSERRDMAAAQRFFRQALDIAGHAPAQVTTDGHDAYPRAIRETLGDDVTHRTSRYKNNRAWCENPVRHQIPGEAAARSYSWISPPSTSCRLSGPARALGVKGTGVCCSRP